MSKRWVTIAIIVAELILLYVLLWDNGWAYDDNLILVQAGQAGFSSGWLTSLTFQHWGIAYHAGFSLVHALMPLDYRWALVCMLALLGGSIYLVQRVVSLMFGWGWFAVVAGAYFGLSIFFTRNLQWFASGWQALPATFFELLCLYGYVRFQVDGARRWVVLSAAALAGGLLFFEKPAYMVLFLALIRILFLARDLRPRALIGSFWGERLMWAALVLVTVLWAIGFHLSGGGTGLIAGTVTLKEYLDYFRILWAQTLIPGLLGVTVPATGLSAGQVLFVVALQIGVVAAVAVSMVRKPAAWRAWGFLAVTVILNGVLIARTRIPTFGAGIAAELRYLSDFAWLVPLAVCLAFHRDPTASPRLDHEAARLAIPRRHRVAAAITVAALIGYIATTTATAAKLQRDWAGHQARAWEAQVRRTFAADERSGRFSVLADAIAPLFMLQSAFAPYNRLSWIVPLYDKLVQVDGVLDGPLVALDANGDAHAAAVASSIGDGRMSDLVASHQVTAEGPISVDHRTNDVCFTATGPAASITRRLVGASSLPPDSYYLRVSYTSRRPTALPLFVDSGRGFPPATDRELRVAPAPASSILFLDSTSPHRLRLVVDPGNTLCIRRFDVVTLRAVS